MKRYVIVGNGTAAVGCIEGIRAVDREGEITVVSGESRPVYSRPLISYYLEGRTDLIRMRYRGDSFYADNGCHVVLNRCEISSGNVFGIQDGNSSIRFRDVAGACRGYGLR